MTDNQKKALELYLESATIYNGFETLSDRSLSAKLLENGITATKSTVQRWRIDLCFDEHLKLKIDTAIAKDNTIKDIVSKSSNSAIIEKTTVDFAKNQDLLGKGYEVIEVYLNQLLEKINKGMPLTKEDADMALKIATMLAGREDKMLDRKTLLDAAERISKEDVLKRLSATLDIDNNNGAIDVEIEE